MYTKINRRWSFKVLRRIRVQILTFSVILTIIQLVKITFITYRADLLMLLATQMLRFIIWSLTLLNFLKSSMELMVRTNTIALILKVVKISTWVGAAAFTAYAIFLITEENKFRKDVLSCHTVEFVA